MDAERSLGHRLQRGAGSPGWQVDEPALREGLPLKRERWESYLNWAVRSFRCPTPAAAPPPGRPSCNK